MYLDYTAITIKYENNLKYSLSAKLHIYPIIKNNINYYPKNHINYLPPSLLKESKLTSKLSFFLRMELNIYQAHMDI